MGLGLRIGARIKVAARVRVAWTRGWGAYHCPGCLVVSRPFVRATVRSIAI